MQKNNNGTKRRLNTNKSLRLFISDKVKLFEANKISEEKLKTFCYAIRLIADLLKNDVDIKMDELEKKIDSLV